MDAGAIDIDRIPGFSTNIIPKSRKEHLFIDFKQDFKKEYTLEWNIGDSGLIPPKLSYDVLWERKRYFIPLLKIHGFKGKYNPHPNKENAPLIEFELKVVHKPLISNYWHFEFAIFGKDGEIKGASKGKGYRNTIYSSIRAELQEIAIFNA